MPDFSDKQLEVINARDCNILVSAAAGSGKTTVLVERIIQRILRDGMDIDQILVLTFTRAAAGEMKERIAAAINKAVEENPGNEHLQRQVVLIYNAQITTIDSFCLDIVKNNFSEIGVEPDLRIATEAEMTFLTDELLEETIEEILSSTDIEYIDEFLGRFESKDNIKKIKTVISSYYSEAQKAPFPEDYLEQHRHDYDVENEEDFSNMPWVTDMCSMILTNLKECLGKAERLIDYCEENGLDDYIPSVESDLELFEKLLREDNYSDIRCAFAEGISWAKLKGIKAADEKMKEATAYAQKVRNGYKEEIDGIKNSYFACDLSVLIPRMQQSSKILNALTDITFMYLRKLEEEKRRRKLITFADIEHMALKILLRKQGNEYIPSQIALDYRSQYKELMIDEYQDSNYIQEALIHSISGEDEGRYDRFMVGDIKQSIYRFRNANPELFVGKYHEYKKDSNEKLRIDLSMNYRSRASVIDFTNVVFERVMDEELGGASYDSDSRLYCGGTFAETDCDTKAELLYVKKENDANLSPEELESMLIARKIHDLKSDYMVQDKKTSVMRPCDYRDIVILVRSGGDLNEVLKRTLEKQGIPAYITSKSGYFTSNEIVTLLNYLAVINNPYNDIELYGSLTSVFGGFSDNEAAILRILSKGDLYTALIYSSQMDVAAEADRLEDIDEATLITVRDKASNFLQVVNSYRELVPYTPIHDLLRKIINDYEYIERMSALPMGEQKAANALMLLRKAEGFEENGFKGLYNFINYIEKLKKYSSDEGEVVTLDENANVVRIMTMHKSKGLEFPVCILSNLHKKYNTKDETNEIVYHNRYGIGFDYIDTKRHAKYRDVRKKFIASQVKKDSHSEEIRVLYVAMTRAKEKLIMTAVIDKDKEYEDYPEDGSVLSALSRLNAKSNLELLQMSRYGDDWKGQCAVREYDYESLIIGEISDDLDAGLLKQNIINRANTEVDEHNSRYKDIENMLNFSYPHSALANLFTKTSVSELKMASIHEGIIEGRQEELPADFLNVHEEQGYIPSFAGAGEKEASGTVRGSAYHRVMELLDFKGLSSGLTEEALDEQMKRHIESGALVKEDYELVNKKKVCRFAESKLCERMSVAAKENNLMLEQPFVLGIAANRLNAEFPEEEQVLIQGIIDAFFIEDGEIVLMDYKTDSVKRADELVKRYATQLDYYEEALTRILGMRVKERLIYSFALEETISL